MDSVPGIWDALNSQISELGESAGDVDASQNFNPKRKSLLPSPLCLHSTPTTTTPRPEPSSPPESPSPTVFVSLRYAEPIDLSSAQLSLHEYRKHLSSPPVGSPASPPLQRTLKRKPKALDLHNLHSGSIPPSPPPSPSSTASSSSSDISLAGDLATQSCLTPESEPGREQAIIASRASSSSSSSELNTPVTNAEQWHECQQETQLPTSVESTPRRSQHGRLRAFRDYIRQIPTRFIHHNKLSSDSTMHQRPMTGKVLRHKGVSFEILSPPDKPAIAPSRFPEIVDAPSSNFFGRRSISDPSAANMPVSCPSRSVTPTTSPEAATRRPTPARAIFEDLPTAHSSITSRTGGTGKRVITSPELYHKPCYFSAELLPHGGGSGDEYDIENDSPSVRPRYHGYTGITSHGHTAIQDPLSIQDSMLGVTSCSASVSTPSPRNMEYSRQRLSSQYSRGQSIGRKRQNDGQRRERSKLTKRPPCSKPKGRKRKSSHHQSPICPRVRPIINNFLNRHQPSLRALRGRVDKPGTISIVRRRNHNNARHTKVVDGFLYDLQLIDEIPAHAPDAASIDPDTEGRAEGVSDHATPKGPNVYLKDDFAPAFSRSDSHLNQYHLSTNPACHRPLQTRSWRESLSSPNFSWPIESDIPHLTSLGKPFGTESTVPPSQTQDTAEIVDESVPDQQFSSESTRSKGRLGKLSIIDDYLNGTSYSIGTEIDDLGPGSSQTTSTTKLSQHTMSSAALKSQMQLPIGLSCRSFETNPYSSYSLAVPPPLYEGHGSLQDAHSTRSGNGIRSSNTEEMDYEAVGEDNDLDWETVAGSQQFGTINDFGLGQSDSGSSLANYSTFGSLANREASTTVSARGNSPLQNELTPAGELLHRAYPAGAPGGTSDYDNHSQDSSNPLSAVVPPLAASTRKCPAPIRTSSSRYRHPCPLGEAHNHPFRSSPPPLFSGPTHNSKTSRSGPITALRSSKLNFHDACQQEARRTVVDKQSNGSVRSLNMPCPSPDPPVEVVSQEKTPYSPIEQYNNLSIPQAPNERRPTHPKSSIQNTALPAAETSKADQRSDEGSVSGNLDIAARNIRRQYLNPLRKLNNARYEDSARSASTEPLIDERPTPKFPPGSLYLSIRSGGSQAAGSSSRGRTRPTVSGSALTNASPVSEMAMPSPPINACEATEQRSREAVQTRARPASNAGPRARATSPHLTCTPRRKESRRQDDAIRERLNQIDTSAPSNFRSASPSRRISRPAAIPLRDLPPSIRDNFSLFGQRNTLTNTASVTAYSASGWDEESTLAPDWYCTRDGRYAFSEPPRLIQPHGRQSHRSTAEYLIAQRHLGRQLILLGSLALPPLGWIVVAFIGIGEDKADALIRWRSSGFVDQFHERERHLARLLGAGFSVITFLAAVITAAVVLAT